ncbi:hypothetical protein QYM36_011730 [Artemia franciscana]|uniref:Death domain-containing protein n=1 Tax=Artemia franciscana TaxID=6661 RepID=A0AA88HVX6_ARTSF|nr:hypothetical protein QYM36_011730 [Artemia franciscana]
MFVKMKTNPKLDALRSSVPSPPDITPMYERWLKSGENVLWARCLGYKPGWRANKSICRYIDASNPGQGDWKDFASELGVHHIDMKRIENTYGREGPTCRVLEEYLNIKEATVSHLLQSLRKLGREDILFSISPYLDELFQLYNSGYPPLPIEPDETPEDNNSDSGVSSVRSISMFSTGQAESRPVESVPLQLKAAPETKKDEENGCKDLIENNDFEDAKSCDSKGEIEEKKGVDFKVVLLTYANDGRDLAKDVAKRFRKHRPGLPRLGVVTLEENEEFLCVDPWGIIQKWFFEVDYIVPILTEEYLERISSHFVQSIDSDNCFDARYVRLIYTMMCNEFMQRGCLNYRVRPLMSNEILAKIDQRASMKNPIFMAWKKVDDCDALAGNMLKPAPRSPAF